MAPKASSAGKEKLIDDDEEVLQAVVLADSFNKRFRPLTTHKPRCLLPICNAPLLDWTFESLALAGVQEIFVVCRSHAEQVKTAIKESKWSQPGSGIKIVPVMTAKETFSPGDAMRDIYTRGLVTSDFVLVMGDLVSNIRIDEVVRVHKERRKTNKDAIMTMVVKESGARHRTRARGDSSVFVLDAETSECLYYEPVTAFPSTHLAHIPREILAEHPEIEIRNDLIDCSIDICSVEVPSLFQDNFDYGDIRKDFVHGVLTSDLLMKNIHCYVAKDGYAARVKDTKSYESVSKDILSRWTFPLVPDDYHPSGHIYNHERGNKYIAKDGSVSLARTCFIGNNTLIGSSTSIDEGVEIKASVIGRNCTIGESSKLDHAYIFDGVSVGDHCQIARSIIGENVAILDGSIIPEGCIIADNVIVGPNARLRPFERLSAKRNPDDEDADDEDEEDDDEDVDSDIENVEAIQDSIPKDLGDESNALVWPSGPTDPDDEDDVVTWNNERLMRLGDQGDGLDQFSDLGSESSSGASDAEDESIGGDFDAGSLGINTDSLLMPTDGQPMAEQEFQAEVKQSLDRAFAEGHSVDNAAVELKTLRMASNVSLTKVRQAVVSGIVDRIPIIAEGGIPQRREIAQMVDRWGELIDKIGGVDPVETITVLQEHCATSERMPLFGQILAAFYQSDIVEEDDIRKWHRLAGPVARDQDGETGDNLKKTWMVGARMIKQFDEQESEDDDDDADEESSEDEKPPRPAPAAKAAKEASESEDDEDEDEEEEKDEAEEEEDEEEDEEEKPSPTVLKAAAKPSAGDSTDEDDEADHPAARASTRSIPQQDDKYEDDSDEEQESITKPPPPPAGDDENDDEEEEEAKVPPKLPASQTAALASAPASKDADAKEDEEDSSAPGTAPAAKEVPKAPQQASEDELEGSDEESRPTSPAAPAPAPLKAEESEEEESRPTSPAPESQKASATTDEESDESDEESPLSKSTATLKPATLPAQVKEEEDEEEDDDASPSKPGTSELESTVPAAPPAQSEDKDEERLEPAPAPAPVPTSKNVAAQSSTEYKPVPASGSAENTDEETSGEEETDGETEDEKDAQKNPVDPLPAVPLKDTSSAAPAGSDKKGESTDEEDSEEGSEEEETEDEEEVQKKPAEVHRDRSATVTQSKPEAAPSSTVGSSTQDSLKDEDTGGETEEEETEDESEIANKPAQSQRDRSATVTQPKGKDPEPPEGIPFPSNKSEGSSIGAPHDTNDEENEEDQFFRDQFFRRQPTSHANDTVIGTQHASTQKPVRVAVEAERKGEDSSEDDGSEEESGSEESDE